MFEKTLKSKIFLSVADFKKGAVKHDLFDKVNYKLANSSKLAE